MKKTMVGAALLAAAVTIAAGCGSSKSGSSGGSGSGGKTITIGVLCDLTGLAATNSSTCPLGVKAGVGLAASEGYKINYVVADTATSPSAALSGAQKLVEQDHVFAVIASSALAFAAAPYLASHGIPVIGSASDSTEWITDKNMFSVIGTQDFTKVYSQYGLFYKLVGGTNLASIGYSVSPSSSESAKAIAASAESAGLKVGYINASFPFGGTNVGPAVVAMKNAGIDSFTASIETNTEFAMISGLRNQGVNVKALLATGYGADLTTGGPGAEQVAQGLYFLTSDEPFEMNTPATQQAHKYMAAAGIAGDPSFAEFVGYEAVDALVQGLKAAGSKPTQASLIDAMLGIRNYNAAGLYGDHSVGFAMDQRGIASGPDNCFYVTKYEGSTFQLVPGADPICGAVVPGKTVSASS